MTNNAGELSEETFAFKKVTWKISNFLDLPRSADYYATSPEFRFANATWCLRMYTSIETHCSNIMTIHLVRLQSSVPEHCIYHTIGLVTCRGREHETYSGISAFKASDTKKLGNFHRHSDIMAKRHILVPNGTVTVFCQIRVKEEATPEASFRPQQRRSEPTRTELQEASSQTKEPESGTQTELQEASSQTEVPESLSQAEVEEESTSVQKLQLDYSKLLKSEEDSDVCLKVSDKEFRAHRCILRARSKVFSAMFKHETEEKATGKVVIDDLDTDSFPDFLQHVYTGRVESLSSKNMSSLYSAADKYDLQELKSECRDYMQRTLSVDTFCDVMTLALRHQEQELLEMASDYFSANFAKIFVTVNWQRFLTDHPTVANELLIKSFVPEKENE